MKCKICKKENQAGALFINTATSKSDYVCLSCQLEQEMANVTDLRNIDKQIKDLEGAVEQLKYVVEQTGSMKNDFPPELMAFSPLSLYKTAEVSLAKLKARRMELLLSKDATFRLKYELNKALEKEDFKKAAQLQRQLQQEE